MHNIWKFINENKKEAYELLKNNGGRIDFINDPEREDIDSDEVFKNENLPWVGLPNGNGVADYAVLAAECDGDGFSILVYNTEENCSEGWQTDAECIYGSENYVYTAIIERLTNK